MSIGIQGSLSPIVKSGALAEDASAFVKADLPKSLTIDSAQSEGLIAAAAQEAASEAAHGGPESDKTGAQAQATQPNGNPALRLPLAGAASAEAFVNTVVSMIGDPVFEKILYERAASKFDMRASSPAAPEAGPQAPAGAERRAPDFDILKMTGSSNDLLLQFWHLLEQLLSADNKAQGDMAVSASSSTDKIANSIKSAAYTSFASTVAGATVNVGLAAHGAVQKMKGIRAEHKTNIGKADFDERKLQMQQNLEIAALAGKDTRGAPADALNSVKRADGSEALSFAVNDKELSPAEQQIIANRVDRDLKPMEIEQQRAFADNTKSAKELMARGELISGMARPVGELPTAVGNLLSANEQAYQKLVEQDARLTTQYGEKAAERVRAVYSLLVEIIALMAKKDAGQNAAIGEISGRLRG